MKTIHANILTIVAIVVLGIVIGIVPTYHTYTKTITHVRWVTLTKETLMSREQHACYTANQDAINNGADGGPAQYGVCLLDVMKVYGPLTKN